MDTTQLAAKADKPKTVNNKHISIFTFYLSTSDRGIGYCHNCSRARLKVRRGKEEG